MVYQQADCRWSLHEAPALEMCWVRALDFADGMFDVVIDKGTLDSILCGEGSSQNAQKMLSEVRGGQSACKVNAAICRFLEY